MARPPSVEIGDQQIEIPREVITFTESLRSALVQTHITFSHEALARQAIRLRFRGATSSPEASAGNRDYYLVLLSAPGNQRFWVGAEAVLRSRLGYYRFHSASLVVFRQRRLTSEFDPLLRAEWETNVDDPASPHAQPHWHVYLASANQLQPVRYVLLERTEQISVEEWEVPENLRPDVADDELGRFHFAMASRWHLSEDPGCYADPTPEGLSSWTKGCLAYTRRQVELIAKA